MVPCGVPGPQRITPSPKAGIDSLRLPAFPAPGALLQLALQFQLEQSQWWPAEHMEARQMEQIQSLLRHAVANVPYYAELFARHGLSVPEKVDAAFLRRIPISRRADLQAAGERLLSKAIPREHGQVGFSTTSGSTCQPLRFGQTQATQAVWRALTLREHLWHRRDFSRKLGAIRFAPMGQAMAPEGAVNPDWGATIGELFATGPAVLANVSSPVEAQLEWLRREQPDILTSLPSALVALARHAERAGVALPPLREVRTVGEKLTRETRAHLAAAWGAKVTDMYSCEETGYLALECPENNHLHVQSEGVWLEIVDEAGAPCPPGVRGRVILTSLANFATPFIRYDLGDLAEFGPPCPCGRGLPVLREVHGRTRGRLLLPNGEDRMPRLGDMTMGREFGVSAGLRQIKCIQHSLEKLELQVVAMRPMDATEQARLVEILLEHIGHPFQVELTFLAEIPRGAGGKLEEFECRIQPGA